MPSAARAERGKGASAKGNRASRGMAGIMWRQCVVVLVFFAWQVSSAGALVNLIEPRVARWAPRTDLLMGGEGGEYAWQLIDNDISTYIDLEPGARFILRVPYQATWTFPLREAIKVRVILAAHVQKQDVPLYWRLGARSRKRSPIKNGMFEMELRSMKSSFDYRLKHTGNKSRKSVAIAEIQLLGPRKALDALWPHGKYPCSRRHEMITPVKGELFSVSKNTVSKKTLSRVFSSDVERDVTARPGCCDPDHPGGRIWPPQPFKRDGSKPVIIGVKFANPIPTVREVMVHAVRWYAVQGVEKVVLEAHKCKPNCSNDGTKGWVKLGEQKTYGDYWRYAFLDSFKLKTAGKYRAYRLKFYSRSSRVRVVPPRSPEKMGVTSIFFLGCKA